MKLNAGLSAAALVFVLLLAGTFWAGSAADPDAKCPSDPNPLRLFPATIDTACVPVTSLWDEWHGRTVVVTAGPYEGQSGVVRAVSGDHVQVVFPASTEGLWFREGQLALEGAPGAE